MVTCYLNGLICFILNLMGLMCSNCMVPFGKLAAMVGRHYIKNIVIIIVMNSSTEWKVVKSFDTKLSLFLAK